MQTLLGWCSTEKAAEMSSLIDREKPALVVEIGVYGGSSLIPQAEAVLKNGVGKIVAIDPWSVDAALQGCHHPQDLDWWKHESKFDLVHESFLQALIDRGLSKTVHILRTYSDRAVHTFEEESINILHIDGNHSESVSLADVNNYLPKIKPGGWVWIDDTNDPRLVPALEALATQCHLIRDYSTFRLYRKRWKSINTAEYLVPASETTVHMRPSECKSLGPVIEWCHKCPDGSRNVHECDVHEKCTQTVVSSRVKACTQCEDWRPAMRQWAYGITTIPERAELLEATKLALKQGGFANPVVFADKGPVEGAATCRPSQLFTAGHWFLSLWELWVRQPEADMYAMFQDDLVCGRNLIQYLDRTCTQEKAYWNLYTERRNQALAKGDGWFRSSQMGWGAVGLVFSREGVKELLTSRYMLERFVPDPNTPGRYRVGIDGGIVMSLKRAGFQELCHSPSLVQHTGMRSTMGNHANCTAPNFAGTDFDHSVSQTPAENGSQSAQVES